MDIQTSLIEPESMPKITSAQVLSTKKLIEGLRAARDAEREARDEEIRHLKWDIYRKKIREIEEERDNAIRALEATRDKAIGEKDQEITAQRSVIQQVERILEILRVRETESLDISEDEVTTRDGTVESLGYLLDDEYLKIKLFIITNSKPKNKYSLIAVGRSIFGEPLVKYPYDYGVDLLYAPRRFSILRTLNDAPTPEVLKDWLKKRKDLAAATVGEYQRLKQEYVTTKQQYKTDDFKELILWTCPQCNNFKTIFEDRGRDVPQCYWHEPYVNMIERR